MSTHPNATPSLEEMNGLMPAYEFESELSANEIGAVYYALQKSLDRYVAVKVFSPAKGSDDGFMTLLKRSSNMMAGLKHPNLIGVIDSGLVEGKPFLVMEFVPGKSLHRSTHGRTIDFKQSLGLIEELCEGMAYAHSNGVIHGNLSPLNILLNQQATPKIGNFALGRGIHTLDGVDVPSHFSAPEVLAGEVHTEACDVYSLGAIFYELITATPYRDGAPRASELEGSPKPVDAVIAKATATDPNERHAGPMEFFKAIKRAASSKPRPSPAAMAPPARNKAMQMAMSTSGTGIAVKIVIIVALLIAIHQVWNYRQAEMERRGLTSQGTETSGETVESFEMTKRQREAQQRQQASRPKPVVVEQPPEIPEIPEAPETPLESLERLRSALESGTFSELPIGAVSQAGSHYFLIEEAMGWEEAVAHAEELGGSIALPDGDMSWSLEPPFQGRRLWLGAARSGTDAFTTVEAKAWRPQSPVAGSERFLYLDESGAMKTASATTKFSYVIQWTEGATPMNLQQRLAACAASIKSGKPVYPPGTLAIDERHYLPVMHSVNWQEAAKLAESAGGHLSALSAEKEIFELENLSSRLATGTTYWMGGHLLGERWQWVTEEPWRPVEWKSVSNAANDGVAMILRASSGIDAMAKSGSADGFIIEWSEDPETNKPQAGVETADLPSPAELTTMAHELVIKAIADKEAAHTKNTDKLAWDLDAHLRGLKKSDKEIWAPEADKLKPCVQNNRLLKETIDNSGARLSPFMAKLCNYIIRKQGEIDEQHQKELQTIHAHYLETLGEIRDWAGAGGQVKAQLAATELIESSQNYDVWISQMSVPQQ